MKQGKTKNILIIVLVVVAVGAAAYFFIGGGSSNDALLTSNEPTAGAVDSGMVSTLRELKRIKLDTSIFTDTAWLSLLDYSKPLDSQEQSRINPFAPFESIVQK